MVNNPHKKNCKVLMIEPSNQLPANEKARPNGTLGPAYIVGSLRRHGIEVDYIDATVGQEGRDLKETFYLREELENGSIRYGMKREELYEIFPNYDIIATSSIFTVQTRMHFEIASIVKEVEKQNNKKILTVCGGVNARSLREHFLSNGFDIIALAEGEDTIIQIVEEVSNKKPDFSKVERIAYRKDGKTVITGAKPKKGTKFLEGVPYPAIDAFPLEVYKKLGSPEAADQYKYSLPEDHAVPEDTLKSFSEEAVKLGLLPNQADGIMKYYNEVINQGVNDQTIKAEEARKVSEQELRQEFGSTFENRITGAKNLATATLGSDFLNNTMLADGSKLGDNPQIVKAFANLSEKLSEDDIVKGDTPDFMTTNDITKQIGALQQPGSAYWDKKHPAHSVAVEEVAALIRKKNNEDV